MNRWFDPSGRPMLFVAVMVIAAALPPTSFAQTGMAYQPPSRGSASANVRVGGGTRGTDDEALSVAALTPAHPGLTADGQPSLYWFVATDVTKPIQITLLADDRDEPVLWLKDVTPVSAGIHEVSLKKNAIVLREGVAYQWFVSVVVDPDNRSKDIIAAGEIERIARSPDLDARLTGAQGVEAARVYAGAGLWYDALESLAGAIGESGGEAARRDRASLLEQVGLTDAAAWDSARAQ